MRIAVVAVSLVLRPVVVVATFLVNSMLVIVSECVCVCVDAGAFACRGRDFKTKIFYAIP